MALENTLYSGRYIDLAERDGWEYASRVHRSGVAVLIPVTPANELVLVEQYRIPVSSAVLELPAGLIGDTDEFANESAESAARRELLEETGYQADDLQFVMKSPTTAGLSDEMALFFFATQLRLTGSGGGDETESIIVHTIRIESINQWLKDQQAEGKLIDPKIYAALYWLEHRSDF